MTKKTNTPYLLIIADICCDSTVINVVSIVTERPWTTTLLVALGLAIRRLVKRQR